MKTPLLCIILGALAMSFQDTDKPPQPLQVFQVEELLDRHAESERPYTSFLRVPAMHAGIYTLAAGTADGQNPHREDEVYYVLKGKAKIRAGDREQPVKPGSIIYVKAEQDHRFTEITEDLELLVLFSTAPSDASGKSGR